MRIILPVIYCKESSVYKMDANLPLDADDCIIKSAIFYKVDMLERLSDTDSQCVLVVSGNEYRINLPIEKVDEIIQSQETFISFN
jgi:hypothetical protein